MATKPHPLLGSLSDPAGAIDRRATLDGPESLLGPASTHDLSAPWAPSLRAAAALLVTSAHLGSLRTTRTLLRELRHDLPRGAHAYWLAVALQRAGDTWNARSVLLAASSRRGVSLRLCSALVERAERPLDPVAKGHCRLDALRSRVRRRVSARAMLSDLALRPWPERSDGPWRWRTGSHALAAWMLFAGLATVALGGPRAPTLVAAGAWRIPPQGLGDAVRLLTYPSLHVGVAHLAVNLLVVLVFGRFVERRYGPMGMLALFLLGGVAGAMAAWGASSQGAVLVGASGAAMALVGATVSLLATDSRHRSTPELRCELATLVALVGLQVALDARGPTITAAAHVGGLFAGFALPLGLVASGRRFGGVPAVALEVDVHGVGVSESVSRADGGERPPAGYGDVVGVAGGANSHGSS